MKRTLLTLALCASVYAFASFVTGFTGDFLVSAVIAVLLLGLVIWLGHIEHERERARAWRKQWAGIDDEYEIEVES